MKKKLNIHFVIFSISFAVLLLLGHSFLVLAVEYSVTGCGDGIVADGEACDDANINSSDGCSGTCAVESGWTCSGQPSSCSRQLLPDTTAPLAVSNLSASNITTSSLTLSWTAPGDDGNQGTASSYDVRYSTTQTTLSSWGGATQAAGEPGPQLAGTSQSMSITGLASNTTYYFAIKSIDEANNTSPISNIVQTKTQSTTLQVVLTAAPNTGAAPLQGVDFTAAVSGTATGNINYTFYCNRADSGTNVTSDWSSKFDNLAAATKTVPDICSYSNPGTYTAKVIVERGALQVENRQIITVTAPNPPQPGANQPPTAVITVSSQTGQAPLAVSFSGSSSRDPDGTITTYEWDFTNDGVADTQGVSAFHTYQNPGTYTAKLKVSDNSNLSASASVVITVTSTPQPAPDTTAPLVISAVDVSVSANSSTISWRSDEASLSWVIYGPTADYGKEVKTSSFVSAHSVNLTGLSSQTTYHYKIKLQDYAGNTKEYEDRTFITRAEGQEPVVLPPESIEPAEPSGEALTIAELKAKIDLLLKEIARLTALIAQLQLEKEIPQNYRFAVNLRLGQSSEDVRYLQIFLKSQGSDIYPEGKITGYFGSQTKNAVVRFQEKYKSEILTPAGFSTGTGIVGPSTRAKINQLLER